MDTTPNPPTNSQDSTPPVNPIESSPTTPPAPKSSISKILIPIVIIIILLVGGFFAYQYLFKDRGSSLIPEELSEYAVGEDANGFVIFKNNEEIKKLISGYNLPTESIVNIKNGLIIFKNDTKSESAVGVFQFETAEDAKEINDMLNEDSIFEMMELDLEIKENLIIVTLGKGLNGFNGSLEDNPLYQSIDPELYDSQFIAYFDYKLSQLLNINTILLESLSSSAYSYNPPEENSVFPTAHAALLSPDDLPGEITEATGMPEPSISESLFALRFMTKYSGIAAKIDEKNLKITFSNQLFEIEEIKEIPEYEDFIEQESEEFEEEYQKTIETLEEKLPEINEMIKNISFLPSGSSTKAEFKDLNFSIIISVDIDDMTNSIQKQMEDASLKAEETMRIADLQRFQKIIINHDLVEGEVVRESGCVEDFKDIWYELDDYLSGKELIDSRGPQKYLDFECESGYFYQYIKGYGFILWAKMDNPENTNTSYTAAEIADEDIDISDIMKSEGSYYIILTEMEYGSDVDDETPVTEEATQEEFVTEIEFDSITIDELPEDKVSR
ncbi:hypothetical protein ACFL21_01540 [Patescibacteria group bacterium]